MNIIIFLGWPGVKGRSCSKPSADSEASTEERMSCHNICEACGMEVGWEKKEIEPCCKCSFKWCCEVECHSCQQTVDHYFCQWYFKLMCTKCEYKYFQLETKTLHINYLLFRLLHSKFIFTHCCMSTKHCTVWM